MKVYDTKHIRNVALLSHLGAGKTSLAESLLFVSKAIHKKGEVEKKTTKSDFLVEEHLKGSSTQTSLIPIFWDDYKINFLDIPGNDELIAELEFGLQVVKGAVIVIDATKGVEVGTEAVWAEVRKRHIPAVLFINKMDKENVDFDVLLEQIRTKLGKAAVPFTYPIGRQADFEGFVNVVEMKAYVYNEAKAECEEAPIWEEKLPKVKALNDMILESVAESSEEMLEKYMEGETITDQEIKTGLRSGIINGELTPVLVGSATKNIGVQTLLRMLIDFSPSPDELKDLVAKDLKGEDVTIKTVSSAPFSGYVFKTMVDPFIGTISFIKINSGTLSPGQEVYHSRSDSVLKINTLMYLTGKEQTPITLANAGDIVVTTKLDALRTNDTISDPKHRVVFDPVVLPTPVLYKAITPKNKNDEDKISTSLQRLNVEDPSFDIRRNSETGQLLIGGYGLSHIQYIVERMRNMFKVEVEFNDQKIVYRETIKKKAESEGKHKKQSGGAGQFGHVWIRFEPSEVNFEFASEVVGGAVAKGYFPAVEKGLIETFEKGPLAGFPVINVKAVLYDGSEHAVDSNELSFKLAAGLAFKNAHDKLGLTILEPIIRVDVRVKDQFVGDIMGDLNKRRGRILGMDQEDGYQIISAEVPESEIIEYSIELKALTQGSGRFRREFVRYEEAPAHIIPKIIAAYKVQK